MQSFCQILQRCVREKQYLIWEQGMESSLFFLAGKTEGKHFTGLEIQADTAEMAQRSVRYNHLEDRVEIVTGDIKEAATIFKPAF